MGTFGSMQRGLSDYELVRLKTYKIFYWVIVKDFDRLYSDQTGGSIFLIWKPKAKCKQFFAPDVYSLSLGLAN